MISILNSHSFSKDDRATTKILILKKIQLPLFFFLINGHMLHGHIPQSRPQMQQLNEISRAINEINVFANV